MGDRLMKVTPIAIKYIRQMYGLSLNIYMHFISIVTLVDLRRFGYATYITMHIVLSASEFLERIEDTFLRDLYTVISKTGCTFQPHDRRKPC